MYKQQLDKAWLLILIVIGCAVITQSLYLLIFDEEFKNERLKKYMQIGLMILSLVFYSVTLIHYLYVFSISSISSFILTIIPFICIVLTSLKILKIIQEQPKYLFGLVILITVLIGNGLGGVIRGFTEGIIQVYPFSTKTNDFSRCLCKNKGGTVERMYNMHKEFLQHHPESTDTVLYRTFPKFKYKYWNWAQYYSEDVFQFEYLNEKIKI